MDNNSPKSLHYAPVAQWIEQWIPNPCAASSILAGGTIIRKPYEPLWSRSCGFGSDYSRSGSALNNSPIPQITFYPVDHTPPEMKTDHRW